ncbi:hypothetical protein A4A49_09709 [Nicotiana attenuata]|uniref:Uncharacterized protein n=1 Tax=Nicotiana attenuata TaxID=49451 RepID=A0A314KYD6_NICAT|nr:hypothetical protein A4A49_09709 [Nicotiana attenuata]
MMHSGWGNDGGSLHVELNEHGQPIGPEASRLSSKLGVIARNGILAPLNYKDWRLVPKMFKDIIWAHIKGNTDATDDMRRMLMISVGSKWKEWKHEAKSCGCEPYDTHGIVRTLGKGAAPSFVYGPVYKRSKAEQRDFDARVEIEVQKATTAIQADMEKKLAKAKEEMKATIDDKVKAGVRAYLESMGITIGSNSKSISNEQVSDNSLEDRQQSLSPVSIVHKNKVSFRSKL